MNTELEIKFLDIDKNDLRKRPLLHSLKTTPQGFVMPVP